MRTFTLHLKDHFPFLGENGCDATVDVYLPYNMTEMNRQNQRRRCLVICPGGGYGCVSQREGEPVGMRFLGEGYNVFILTYSVKPNRFPQAIREVAAVLELISANAESWNCDTEHIALMGFSAGGHLACHYANGYAWPEVREVFPESKPVQASLLCYPVITADPGICHAGSFENLLGHYPLTEGELDRFSCHKMVGEHTPPAFLWHTAEDTTVPVQNSLLYAAALTEKKIPYELHIYPFGWHGLATADRETVDAPIAPELAHTSTWLAESARWLDLLWK